MDEKTNTLARALDGFRGIKKNEKKRPREEVVVNTTKGNITAIENFLDYLVANYIL
jgi:hypothetical protein